MNRNRTAAVVVTRDRLQLLKKCIEALRGQTVPCDILVLDNASSDGSLAWLTEQGKACPELRVTETGANLGGAGGFQLGLRQAVEAGYECIWLMDDDCIPQPDALEKLLEADSILGGSYGWLSSVALWTDGTECKMNRQKLKKSFYDYSPLLKHGLVQAEQATFVSLFLRAETVRAAGLPVKEFFIWGDDIEYTRRIAVRAGRPSFVAGQSVVVHVMAENNGSSLALDAPARISRYRYAFRNEAFTYRQEGFRGRCYYLAKCGLNFCRILGKAKDHRLQRIGVLLGSMLRGLCFRPELEYIEEQK